MENVIQELKEYGIDPELIFQNSREKIRIEIKSDAFMQSMSLNFQLNVYSLHPNKGVNIGDIEFFGDDSTGVRNCLSICLHDKFMNDFVSACPEIIGLLSTGTSKKEALKNISIALCEVTILNHEKLRLNPVNSIFTHHGVKLKQDDTFFSPAELAALLNVEFGFTQFYLTDNNIIAKHINKPKLNFTIPLRNVNIEFAILMLKIAESEWGGSNILERLGY